MNKRDFLTIATGAAIAAVIPASASAYVPVPHPGYERWSKFAPDNKTAIYLLAHDVTSMYPSNIRPLTGYELSAI